MRLSYAIIFVNDMAESVAFYRDVLGLPLRFESPHWTEFDTGGATIALHIAEKRDGQPDDPENVPGGRCRPGISVPNLDEFHQRMTALNIRCIQPPRDLFGTRLAQYVDPDGLGISVSEERK